MKQVPPPPSYVALQEGNGNLKPPPNYHHNMGPGPYGAPTKKKSSCCYKVICCCYCIIFLIIIAIAALLIWAFVFFKPKVPTYEIKNFAVQAFEFKQDFSLDTSFIVSVKADNPNKNIEFIYGSGNSVEVKYKDFMLCSGNIPEFKQGTRNVTVIDVILKGKSTFGSGLHEALVENQKGGKIPLTVEVKVPVNVILAGVKLRRIKVRVNAQLVVDDLSPDKKISILSSKYDINVSM